MKQKEAFGNALEHRSDEVNVRSFDSGPKSKKLLKTSISVPGKVQVQEMMKPETVTVVKTPISSIPSTTDEPLCDDILSCISALDEVIAEFDDSISQSSSSSLTSLASGKPSSQRLRTSVSTTSSTQADTLQSIHQSKSIESIVRIMQKEAQIVTEIQINSHGRETSERGLSAEFRQLPHHNYTKSSPVKPARQGKTNGKSNLNSTTYQIETNSVLSPNGNYTSYGIVFPKATSSLSRNSHTNNNHITITGEPPPKVIGNQSPVDSPKGAGSVFPKIRSNKIGDSDKTYVKSTSALPNKPIPVTFVMKPEDLERFLENDPEEDWNCHIEKNLPRSLRKTRKTCFVEDDEEEQEKYCRSPKDFRKNPHISNESKRSPMLSQRMPIVHQESPVIPPAQWVRYEDVSAILPKEPQINPRNRVSPPFTSIKPNTTNNNIMPNIGDDWYVAKSRQEESPQNLLPPHPVTEQILDIDDGYLSMINRHETPILWPETETFSPDELKILSISNLNYLNDEENKRRIHRNEDKMDYFSDDSLEFEVDTECSHHHKIVQQEKTSSFILASTQSTVIQPLINKSSTRKSWSPASEIRIPTKPLINTNTWRKGSLPPSALSFDENQEDRFIIQKKASSPVRKPCAFFIPIRSNPEESKHNSTNDFPESPVLKIPPDGTRTESEKHGDLESPVTHSLEFIATKITQKVLKNGIQEAACIDSLLTSTSVEASNQNNSDSFSSEYVSLSVDPQTIPGSSRDGISPNSSLGLSIEDKLSSSSASERRELETTSSSGVDYETSSEGHENHYDSLQGDVYNNVLEDEELHEKHNELVVPSQSHQHIEDIEDLNENPPPFIPPPPQVLTTTPVLRRPTNKMISSENDSERTSMMSNGTESDRDSFPQSIPSRVNPGERALRTQRQTSRSHENLLDIDRMEYLPHPYVRRGHSATLPSNAIPPLNGRRPSGALRLFFGIFRRNKKQSNGPGSSVMDLPVHSSPSCRLKPYEPQVSSEDDSPQLLDNLPSSYKYNQRPSISESHGSQRSNNSKTSSKRSVLSRIFRRKEKSIPQ